MKKEWNDCFRLDIQAEKNPNKKAVITEQDSISYLTLSESSSRIAAALRDCGAAPGDTVLIFMPNCIAYAAVFFAAARLGLNIAPANALSKKHELSSLIQAVHPSIAFTAGTEAASLLRISDPMIPIVCLPDLSDIRELRLPRVLPGRRHACQRPDQPEQTAAYNISSNDAPFVFLSTSGSTGTPKVVCNTFESERINAELYTDTMKTTSEDIILTALPVTQRFGMAAMLGSCLKGCTLILASRFLPSLMLSLIAKYRVTIQYGVPTVFLKEKNAFETAGQNFDLSSLRTGVVAGAGCPAELFRWFEAHAGCRLLNCYGTSEIGGVTMVDYADPSQLRHHTCGRPLHGATIEIRDHNGAPLPAGETGEIACRVPWVMKGYARDPKRTAAAFDGKGFFLTGDIGKTDCNGYLTVSGRKKDLIIRGGYNIAPAEVEQALLRLPQIREVCVMGYGDPLLGERIIAFTESSDPSVSEEQVRRELGKILAAYKLPDRIIYLDEIPKLPNGKFDLAALKLLLNSDTPPAGRNDMKT